MYPLEHLLICIAKCAYTTGHHRHKHTRIMASDKPTLAIISSSAYAGAIADASFPTHKVSAYTPSFDRLPCQFISTNTNHGFSLVYDVMCRTARCQECNERYWMGVEDVMCSLDDSQPSVRMVPNGLHEVPVASYMSTHGVLLDNHTGLLVHARTPPVCIPPAIIDEYVRDYTGGTRRDMIQTASHALGSNKCSWYKTTDKTHKDMLAELMANLMHNQSVNGDYTITRDAVVTAFVRHAKHKGVPFVDVMPALRDKHEELAHLFVLRAKTHLQMLNKLGEAFDGIVALQSRGYLCLPILLANEVAKEFNTRKLLICPAFKEGAIPESACVAVEFTKEYSATDSSGAPIPETLCMHRDTALWGKRVLVLDDVIATGGSAAAAVELAISQGARVLGVVVVSAIAPLLPKAVEKLNAFGVPLFVLT